VCNFCRKIRITKEIVSSYFTDEEMIQLAREMGIVRGGTAADIRVAVVIMAATELAMDNGLGVDEIKEAYSLAIARRMLQRTLGYHHED